MKLNQFQLKLEKRPEGHFNPWVTMMPIWKKITYFETDE